MRGKGLLLLVHAAPFGIEIAGDRALQAGFVEYLTKPLRLPRLTETLGRFAPRPG